MMIAKWKIAAMRATQTRPALLLSGRLIHLLYAGRAAAATAAILAVLLGVTLFGAPGFFNAYAQGSGDGNSATCAGAAAVTAAPYNTPPADTNTPLIQDCNALLSAKSALAGTTGNLNWSANLSIGSWDGVTLTTPSDANSRVSALNLDGQNLNGVIPAGLKTLTQLETLQLPNNQLTGGIPAELAELKRLTTLDLTGNRLTGTLTLKEVRQETAPGGGSRAVIIEPSDTGMRRTIPEDAGAATVTIRVEADAGAQWAAGFVSAAAPPSTMSG